MFTKVNQMQCILTLLAGWAYVITCPEIRVQSFLLMLPEWQDPILHQKTIASSVALAED